MQAGLIRVGMVGVGDIGAGMHLPTLLGAAGCELVAVADVRPEAVAAVAARLPGSTRVETDPARILGARDVDAVVLATPPWVTHRLAHAALAAGKYVLAEKPLAPTLAEARALQEVPGAWERLQVGFAYRHHPAVDRLRDIVRSDALGAPILMVNLHADEASDPAGDPEHEQRILETLFYGPPVIHDGAHMCDRLNLIFGTMPEIVTAWSLRTEERFPTANVTGAVLAYPGALVRIENVWMLPRLPPSELFAVGSRGRVTIDPPTFRLVLDTLETSEVLEPPGDKREVCFALQLRRFLDSCAARRPVTPGLADGLASLDLTERIAAAALARAA